MSHFSCFFFRKRRNKRNQTEREKRRKATAVSLGVLEKRLFRIRCSDRFSSLRRDCGVRIPSANPTVPDLLVSSDGGGDRSLTTHRENGSDRLWAVVVRSLLAVKKCNGCQHIGGGRLLATRREGGGGRLWVVVVRTALAVKQQKRWCLAIVFAFLFGGSNTLFKGGWGFPF